MGNSQPNNAFTQNILQAQADQAAQRAQAAQQLAQQNQNAGGFVKTVLDAQANEAVKQAQAAQQAAQAAKQPVQQAQPAPQQAQPAAQQAQPDTNEGKALELQSKDEFSAIFYSEAGFQGKQTVVKAGQTNVAVGIPLSITLGKNVNLKLQTSQTQKDKDGNIVQNQFNVANTPQWQESKDKRTYSLVFRSEYPVFADVILHTPNPSCACSYAPVVSSFENFENTSQEYYFYIIILITVLLIAYVNREKIIKFIGKKD